MEIETIKFTHLSIDDMKQLVFQSNISIIKQREILTFLAKYQDFSNPDDVNEIFRLTEPSLVLTAPTLSIKKILETDIDGFWQEVFSTKKIIRLRYIDDQLIENYPHVFNLYDAITFRPLSTNQLLSFGYFVMPLEKIKLFVKNQKLPRTVRNLIRCKIDPKQMLEFQNLDDDEIISICQFEMETLRKDAAISSLNTPDPLLTYFIYCREQCRYNPLLSLIFYQKISLNVLITLGRELVISDGFFSIQHFSERELISIIEFARGEPSHPYQPSRSYFDVNWDDISRYKHLSEDFMCRFRNHLNWELLSRFQKLSVNFIHRYSRHICFKTFFQFNRFITKEIIIKFLKRGNFTFLQQNEHFDKKLFKKIIVKYDFDSFTDFGSSRPINHASSLQDECKMVLSSRHFNCLDNMERDSVFDVDSLKSDFGYNLNNMMFNDNIIGLCTKLRGFYPSENDTQFWEFVWKWCTCSEDFINFYIKNYGTNGINWKSISQYQKLSLPFIKKYHKYLAMDLLLSSQSFSSNDLDEIVKLNDGSVELHNKFFYTQYCSHDLLEKILTKFPDLFIMIIQNQKIHSIDCEKYITNEIRQKFFYKYQQPFFEKDIDIVEKLQFNPTAMNIFPEEMARYLVKTQFVPPESTIMFQIINDIFDAFFDHDETFFHLQINDKNLYFFHEYITNQMLETSPVLFFGRFLSSSEIHKQFSLGFIKNWYKIMSHDYLLATQSLDIELIELLLNTCNRFHWMYFFKNEQISNEIKIQIATKYNNILPIELR